MFHLETDITTPGLALALSLYLPSSLPCEVFGLFLHLYIPNQSIILSPYPTYSLIQATLNTRLSKTTQRVRVSLTITVKTMDCRRSVQNRQMEIN